MPFDGLSDGLRLFINFPVHSMGESAGRRMSSVFRCGHISTAAESKSFATPGANRRRRPSIIIHQTENGARTSICLAVRAPLLFLTGSLLRQIVTERSEEHVVQPFGLQSTLATPGDAVDIRILQAPLQAPAIYLLSRAVVNLVPEASRPFN